MSDSEYLKQIVAPERKRREPTDSERLRRGITPRMRDRAFDRNGGCCVYCGFIAGEVDHIVPVMRGGGLDSENLAAACHECNKEKLDRTVDEWAASRRLKGQPWPIPSFFARVIFLTEHGLRYRSEDGRERYEKFRALIVGLRNAKNLAGYAVDPKFMRKVI